MSKKNIEEDVYNGQFLIDDKLQDVVQDLLSVLEKWQLRMMEKQIALQQATQYIDQEKMNIIAQSRNADGEALMQKYLKKLGWGDD